MTFNVKKCEFITFSRRAEHLQSRLNYSLDGLNLRVSTTIDLGVVMDEKMTFKPHLNQIFSRAKAMLGFVKRQSKEFDCPYVTRSLYFALVRPIVEYCSVVWNPVFEKDIIRLESIQK